MREAPKLAEATIAAALRAHYGISIASLTFLPLGEDSASAAYSVHAADGAVYFLKTRSRPRFNPANVAVPRYLREMGVPHILAPLLTKSQTSWVMMNDFALTLYPFVDGRIGGDAGLSEQHWIALGRTLKQIHTSLLPPDLMQIVPRETFVPSRRSVVDDLENAVSGQVLADPEQRELAAFWNSRREQIRRLVNRADALGRRLREASAALVLCHADLHTRNVLLEGKEQLWVVDWDETILAPKERDLMFFVGGIMRELLQPHHTEYFFRGYGDTAIDPDALVYYRNAWAVQDIGAYGELVFFLREFGEASRQHAVRRFMQLFEPGNIVSIALAEDGAALISSG
jgi:spectinomycin phosphotransferase